MIKIFQNIDNSLIPLKIFRTIGLIFFIVVLILIIFLLREEDYENSIKLLVPLGVLISAFIASFSVMMSIENTNKNEIKKLYREKIEEMIFLIQELIEIFDVLDMEHKSIDPRKLTRLSILINQYTPKVVEGYTKLEYSIHQSIYINNEKDMKYSVDGLKDDCVSLQMELQEELKKYL